MTSTGAGSNRVRGSLACLAALFVAGLMVANLIGAAAAGAAGTGPPTNVTTPSVGGIAQDEQRLKALKGSWTGQTPITYSYAWSRCDASGEECEAIPTGLKASYRATHADVGNTLRVKVTATNEAGKASALSDPSSVVVASPPRKKSLPKIGGIKRDGQLLTASPGLWRGTPPFSYAYKWEDCDALGLNCSIISGAQGSTYRPTTPEIGKRLRAIVTAKNVVGSATATSAATVKLKPGPPVDVGLPSLTGSLQEGQTLTANVGDWAGTGPFTFSYQWQRCSILGGGCEAISGAIGATYVATSEDIAHNLSVVVTASNSLGMASATSPEGQTILAILPTNTVLPSISGVLQDGSLLTANPGSWTGSEPITYTYQWQLCNALGKACSELTGATGSTLKLDPSEIGKTLAVVVTAKNAAGTESATSSVTSLIEGILPKNTSAPSISGSLVDGQLLTANSGEWSGSQPITYTYQWQLCNALGASCGNISEATGSTLKLISSYVGSTLRLVVTAKNAAGSTSETSSATTAILALLPKNTTLPSITGLLKNGATLTALTGEWSGTTPMTFGYQWQLCVLKVCSNILNATNPTFVLVLGDVGNTLRVIVTAKNAAGSVPATSAETGSILGL
jgi:hypothetical protein